MLPRTIENGLLRPSEPIQDFGNQVYLVTILDRYAFRAKSHPQQNRSLRGNIGGYLSSAEHRGASKLRKRWGFHVARRLTGANGLFSMPARSSPISTTKLAPKSLRTCWKMLARPRLVIRRGGYELFMIALSVMRPLPSSWWTMSMGCR